MLQSTEASQAIEMFTEAKGAPLRVPWIRRLGKPLLFIERAFKWSKINVLEGNHLMVQKSNQI
jgi:hypothetical protein